MSDIVSSARCAVTNLVQDLSHPCVLCSNLWKLRKSAKVRTWMISTVPSRCLASAACVTGVQVIDTEKWQKRCFMLSSRSLVYKDSESSEEVKGEIPLHRITAIRPDENGRFDVEVPQRVYELRAESEKVRAGPKLG